MIDILKIRKSNNLTQQKFADALGVSVRTVQDWEQGRRHPDRRSKIALKAFIEKSC